MVTSEMSWFVRYCLHQRDECVQWEVRARSCGAEAFARGRADMWRCMAVFAAQEFAKRRRVVIDVVDPDLPPPPMQHA